MKRIINLLEKIADPLKRIYDINKSIQKNNNLLKKIPDLPKRAHNINRPIRKNSKSFGEDILSKQIYQKEQQPKKKISNLLEVI